MRTHHDCQQQSWSSGMGRRRHSRGADGAGKPQAGRPDAGLPQRSAPAHPVRAGRDARPGPGPRRLPAVQGHRGIAQVPQGRKVRRGDRRRPDRPGQLPLQPHRTGPPPCPGRDEAVRLRRPGAGAAGGLRRANLSPGGHRHQLQPRAAAGRLRPPGHQGGAVQRHRPGHRQRPQRVHLRPARQRQDVGRPRHRRIHEQRRRRNLRPLRLPGRKQHHHRLRSVAAPARRRRREATASRTTRPPSAG